MPHTPIKISLTDFIDFVVSSGPPKLTKVRQLKARPEEYQRVGDFWGPLRERIIDCHRLNGHSKAFLDGVLKALTDGKKATAYPPLIAAYKKFIGQKQLEYSIAPKTEWHHGRLRVRINPELILRINGQRHTLIKLYFKSEQLSKSRVSLIQLLMAHTLEARLPAGIEYGVLEVRRNKLYGTARPNYDLLPLLEGEADNFITVWDKVKVAQKL